MATGTAIGSVDFEDASITDLGSDVGIDTTHATTWGTIDPGAGKNVVIGYASAARHDEITNYNAGAFRLDGITAGFETATLDYQNEEGYTEQFRVYKCLAANTLGRELNTHVNATSITNEGDATTGWDSTNLAVFQSQGTTKYHGDYALEVGSPTLNGGRAFLDLEASPISCVDVKIYTLSVFTSHTGTGGTWGCQHGASEFGTEGGVIVTLDNTDTTFTEYTATWTHDNDHRYINAQESSLTDDGGLFIDKLSIKEIAALSSNNGTTIVNEIRYGLTSIAIGSLTDDNINSLTGVDTGEAIDIAAVSYGTINSTGSDKIVIAFPELRSTNVPTQDTNFRIGGITAGFNTLPKDPHVNRLGYSEDYDMWMCDIANTGNYTFDVVFTTNAINERRWGAVTLGGGDDVNDITSSMVRGLASYDILGNASSAYSAVNPGSGDYVCIAFPTRLDLGSGSPDSTVNFRIDGITAGFEQNSPELDHQNRAGYNEDYDVWRCLKDQTGNYIPDIDDEQTTVVNEVRFGTNTTDAIGSITDAEINALTGVSILEDVSGISYGTIDASSGGKYILVAHPVAARMDNEPTSELHFRLNGITAGFERRAAFSHMNRVGYSENYDLWQSTLEDSLN